MEKKKIVFFSLVLAVLLITITNVNLVMAVENFTDNNSEHNTNYSVNKEASIFKNEKEIKIHYAPINENNLKINNVKIESVIYYDKNNKVAQKFYGDDAIKNLLDENYNIKDDNISTKSSTADFYYRVVNSSYTSNSKVKNLSKKIEYDDFVNINFVYNCALAFSHPFASIVSTTIQNFFPKEIIVKAGDILQQEIYVYRTQILELKQRDNSFAKWFGVVWAESRKTNLIGSFYLVNDEGEVSNFSINFGPIRFESYKNYDNESALLYEALAKWNRHPYYYKYDYLGRLNGSSGSAGATVKNLFKNVTIQDKLQI